MFATHTLTSLNARVEILEMTTEEREDILNNIESMLGRASRDYWSHKSDQALREWQEREDWCMEHEFDEDENENGRSIFGEPSWKTN
jgi:hypothetical protein